MSGTIEDLKRRGLVANDDENCVVDLMCSLDLGFVS